MITNDQISQGAITETKLSKNLRLPHTNLKSVNSAQVLLGNADGNLTPTTISGDISLSASGVATLNRSSIRETLTRMGVVRQGDFSGNNTMLFAVHDGEPKAVGVEELKVLLGIPNVFNSSVTETAFLGATGGGGGGLVKIKSFTETVGANPFVIDGFSDTYDSYRLVCHDAMSTAATTDDIGARLVYGSTIITTNNYESSRDLDGASENGLITSSTSSEYGILLSCMENANPCAFHLDLYHFRNTAATAVLLTGMGISYHDTDFNQYQHYAQMKWAGGIATADRKIDGVYLYPLESNTVEAAADAKIKGKFTLYGYQK